MAEVLIAPLTWGLGHATRDLPIARELLARGHRVTFAAAGPALALLRQELPQCETIEFPDYPPPFGGTRFFMTRFALGVPQVLAGIRGERFRLAELLARRKFDLVISDNRLGLSHDTVPCYLIGHQLRFCMPAPLRWLEPTSASWNDLHNRKFTGVLVPDNPPGGAHLTGRLSIVNPKGGKEPTRFIGILSSVARAEVTEDLDYLISISGPGPQRAKLESILLPQVPDLPGRKVVLLGKPHEDERRTLADGTEVRSHASREEMTALMNRAKFIVSRSGYTTVMEMAELGKKRALFFPTPGQTEQEHLSWLYERKRWFHSASQHRLRLAAEVARCGGYTGFPDMPRTADNVRKLYDEVFARHLTRHA